MATSRTSIVGMKFESHVIMGIDSRMCLFDYTTVASNHYRKTIPITNGKVGKDERIVFVGFSGDTPLLKRIKKELPVHKELKKNLTPSRVAEWVKAKVDIQVRKERVCYGIVIIGIGETGNPEMFLVKSYDWTDDEKSLMVSTKKMMNTSSESIGTFCVAGTGAEWLKPFIEGSFLGAEFPLDLQPNNAKDLVMTALRNAAQNDPGTGGILQAIVITNEGGFKLYRHFQYQRGGYEWCGMPYLDWLRNHPPLFDD